MENKANITVYRVPLVCGAAPHIGCGSRSKPVLLDLLEQDSVDGAWLNRPGTMVAVRWKHSAGKEGRLKEANSVFAKHRLSSEVVAENGDQVPGGAALESDDQWLSGRDVDELSREEAKLFADRLMRVIRTRSDLDRENDRAYHGKIADLFFDFFLNYESVDQLSDVGTYRKLMRRVLELGREYTTEDQVPGVDELLETCAGLDRNPADSADCNMVNNEMKEFVTESTITCPECGHPQTETMPTDACQFFYECSKCKALLRPKTGDCCVYCSYGTVKCPPMQTGAAECC